MKLPPALLPIAALLLGAAPLLAQDTPAPRTAPQATGLFDFVGRGTHFGGDSDEGRFKRYRDLRPGATLDLLQYGWDTDMRRVRVEADHVGYRDQRYALTFNQFGALKGSFEWNETPLFFSDRTATLYTADAPGVLRIGDPLQTALENRSTTLASAVGQALPFDLRAQRRTFDLKVTASPARALDLSFALKSAARTGEQPWAGTFGFGNAVELAAPLDTRTTDVGTAIEWSNSRGLARVGYDGSFFRNAVDTLVWDNPLRVSDSPTAGPLQGRMALWPDSNMNTTSATGMLNLPRRSRATAYVSVGRWTQDAPLVPFTVNSALPAIALDRATAQTDALVTSMVYSFNSRPTRRLWVNARYRSYDFDNRTPVFHVSRTVVYDTSVSDLSHGGTSPYGFKRRTFDADASISAGPFTAYRVGYTRQEIDQRFRQFDTTAEDTVRLSADTSRVTWLTLRGVYEHARRTGSGLDDQVLDDIGEQTALRQFDISNRDADRVSAIVQVMPVADVSVSGTVSAGREERPETAFGLRSNNSRSYSLGVDVVPGNAVSAGVSYTYEKYTALQASRQANPGPQFDDPTRDWTTDSADRAHTVTAALDLIKVWPKTDVRVAYDYSRAQSIYVYGLAPNSSLAPVSQLPAVVNELQRGTAELRYAVARRVTAGLSYWYDAYAVRDFALGEETLTGLAQPSFLMLGYLYRPYSAQTVTARLIYEW